MQVTELRINDGNEGVVLVIVGSSARVSRRGDVCFSLLDVPIFIDQREEVGRFSSREST